MIYCIVLFILCYVMFILYYIILCYIALHHIILYYIILYYSILYYIILYILVLTNRWIARFACSDWFTRLIYPRITTSRRNFQNGGSFLSLSRIEEEIRQMNEETTPANTKSTSLVDTKTYSVR